MLTTKIDPTDPAAIAAWIAALRSTLATIHSLAIDASAPKAQRVHSRTYLRRSLVKEIKAARAALDALGP